MRRESPGGAGPSEARRAIDATWRREAPRIISVLTRMLGDIGLAEDLAQDALVAALERWPEEGVPRSPGAWLTAVAKRRAIDRIRRDQRVAERHEELLGGVAQGRDDPAARLLGGLDDPVGDDLLGLIFMCCHPLLSPDARVALTLRLVGGLTTEEVARAYVVPTSTVAQRIVRAKRTLREARVPFEVPRGAELHRRVESVLEVVYLIFNEGYAATAGEQWTRPPLCHDAIRLGGILVELAPDEAEVHGLLALMEIQASRLSARVGLDGEPILLMDQDRSRWDQPMIRRGLAALARAEGLGRPLGPYTLQAAIAACHARARTPDETDWTMILALYDALAALTKSPVVELNRAVALAMAEGPTAGLLAVDALEGAGDLQSYHLLPSVRAELLSRLGRYEEAGVELERAASLARNQREQSLLRSRAAELRGQGPIH